MIFRRLKKPIVVLVLTVMLLLNASAFFVPQKAYAQFVVSAPSLEGMQIRGTIMDVLKNLLKGIFFQGIMNALQYFLQKLAYDAAVWLAAGGKGQGTLFEYKSFKDYFKDVGLDTAGEFIGSLSEEWPVDLCAPTLPNLPGAADITMDIQLGIADTYEPRPRCSWNEISANWDEFIATNSTDQVLSQFAQSLRPGEGGLGSILSLHEKMKSEEAATKEGAARDREEGGGFKSVTQKISGYIETPGSFVSESAKQKLIDQPQKGSDQRVDSMASFKDSLITMGLNVGSMFLNTLTSNLFSNIMGGLFKTGDLVSERASLWELGQTATEPEGGRIAAEAIFADLLKPNIIELTSYNPLNEFGACSPERSSSGCVIDAALMAALTQAGSGEPITIKDALKKGFLHSNWPLIPLSDKTRNQDPSCYTYGYCYSNLVKLRKARIIPIGWELAANSPSNNPGNPITLGEVIKNFDNPAPTNPWYHLIDPNWILKLPQTQCKMKVYGQKLMASVGDMREEVCADMPSCIEEDNEGKCVGGFGYCTREKNIWRIEGDSCPREFSSCESMASREGKKVSYLRNTMDYNSCNAGNTGCVWYSTEKKADGSWNSAEQIFLNKNVLQCDVKMAGCADLIKKSKGVSLNYIKNSSLEKDVNADNIPDSWAWTGLSGGYETAFDKSGTQGYSGGSAILLNNYTAGSGTTEQDKISQRLTLAGGNYVISVYAKQAVAGGNAQAQMTIELAAGAVLDINTRNTECSFEGGAIKLRFTPRDFYIRGECNFSLNSAAEVQIRLLSADNNGVWFDAAQLEEGSRAAAYREEGYPAGVQHVYLKKPPAYLSCTGNTLGDNSECGEYAKVCKAEDVGCEKYTPVNGEPAIAAQVSNRDICPAECDGYDLFRQEATNFEAENPAIYLIPTSAKSCTSDVAGCDEFTNTKTEQVSFYSFLRRCADDIKQSAPYYTWEGSDTTGYQLKSWRLVGGARIGSESGTPPAYQDGFTDYAACTESIFRSGADPDCREFYDEGGNISYRLYSKTIVVTNECETLRRTPKGGNVASQGIDCRETGGEWLEDRCIYKGYPAESVGCGAQYAGCRAYTGNTGRNIRVLFEDTFESGDVLNWRADRSGTARVSTESLQVGGHSLKADSLEVCKNLTAGHVKAGSSYLLSFWSKGSIKNISSYLKIGSERIGFVAPNATPVSLATEWRYYDLGPVYIDPSLEIEDVSLCFSEQRIVGGRTLTLATSYFDNIILREVIANIYLIKNSWTIPQSCDWTIEGASLPQAMVGCQAYKDKLNVKRYFKSFTKLCAENVVGCEAFVDTQNTASPYSQSWNARCVLRGDTEPAVGERTPCQQGASSAAYCTVEAGGKDCYFNTSLILPETCGATPSICKKTDTYTAKDDKTIYLVASEQFKCDADNIGCTKTGYPQIKRTEADLAGVSYEDRVLKLDPAAFDSVLCKEKELFCEEYKTKTGGFIFAKDPRDKLCEYKENVVVGGIEHTGWFKKGTDESCDMLCQTTRATSRCTAYSILRNADSDYDGWVGICDGKWSGCTTLIDPTDKTEDYPDGNPYFMIKNDNLDTKSCNGQVSKIEGCVAFRDLNDPSKTYRADSSYLKSRDLKSGGSVPAVDCPLQSTDCKRCTVYTFGAGGGEQSYIDEVCRLDTDCPDDEGSTRYECVVPPSGWQYNNDSNLIIKVTPDRVCGEWLACRSTMTVWDEAAGRDKKICTSLDLCRAYQANGEKESRCVKFVSGDNKNKVLGIEGYKARDVSWSGMEYSGYSIPNQYQTSDLEAVDITGNRRLAHVITTCSGADGSACGPASDKGRCYSGKCVKAIDGSLPTSNLYTKDAKKKFTERSCRAYPEQTSPFPYPVAEWDKYFDKDNKGAMSLKKQGFIGAQVCEKYAWLDANADNIVDIARGELELQENNCDCSYQKVTYGRGTLTKYFDYQKQFVPEGICFGGPRDGLPCVPGVKDICGAMEEGGSCERVTRADKYLGLEGYCLEYDYSLNINASKDDYMCLTWRPVEIPEGGQDVYNQYQSAGYNPPNASVGKYFCVMGKGNADTDRTRYSFKDNYNLFNYAAGGGDDANVFFVSVADAEEYGEAFMPRDAVSIPTAEHPNWPEHKEDIAAIVLTLTALDGGGLTRDGGSKNVANIFKDQKDNILSRNSEHNGGFVAPDGSRYTYWETRLPNTDKGIKDWPTGPESKDTDSPLFVLPWIDDVTFNTSNIMHMGADGGDAYEVASGLTCSNAEEIREEADQNYYAIRAVFNAQDVFVGFWISVCDHSGSYGNIFFDVEFLEAEPCQTLAQVISDNAENKARTDSVWEYSKFATEIGLRPSKVIGLTAEDQDKSFAASYKYGQLNAPFGSAASGFKNPTKVLDPWFIGASEGNNGSPYLTTAYYPLSAVNAGSPLGCGGACYLEGTGVPLTSDYDYASAELRKLFAISYNAYDYRGGDRTTANYQSNASLLWDDTKITDSSLRPLGVEPPKRVSIAAPSANPSDINSKGKLRPAEMDNVNINNYLSGILSGKEDYGAIVRFYAWAYKEQMPIKSRWILWGDGTPIEKHFGKYKNHKPICASTPNEALGYCSGGVGADLGKGLACLKTSDCPAGATCTADTPTWRCSGNLNKGCGAIGGAAGDSTKCRVDYGACLHSPEFNISYCENDDSGDMKCQENADCVKDYGACVNSPLTETSFGNSPGACEEGYFEASHIYVCRKDMVDGLPACLYASGSGNLEWSRGMDPFLVNNSPCKALNASSGNYECVFKPSLRVLDNWDWCTRTSFAGCLDEPLPGQSLPDVKFRGVIIVEP